jgi:integrase
MGKLRAVGRIRTQKTLPKYVILYHGSYYYRGPASNWKRLNLGRDFSEAMEKFGGLYRETGLATMADVFDKYEQVVIPTKAEATQVSNRFELGNLRKVMAHMHPSRVEPTAVYKIRDGIMAKHGVVQSNLHLALLKHIFVKAIEWGACKIHPAREVKKIPVLQRNRDVTDEEFGIVYDLAPEVLQVAMDLALLTGMSRGDILGLTRAQCKEDGIHYTRQKTIRRAPRKIIVTWTPELEAVIARAKKLRPEFRHYIVATRSGKQFSPSGFSTLWQRTMVEATKNGLEERFHFHDIRAKSATETEDLMEASERLGHSSPEITKRVYRRKATRVKPLR